MIKRVLTSMHSCLLLMLLTGCTLVSNLPLPISLIRSPVTLDTKAIRGNLNGPLSAEEACRIKLISSDIAKGTQRSQAISHRWDDTKQPCVRYSEEQSGQVDLDDKVDNLEDLQGADVLVLIAMSGGGSRAASLAAHTMSLLEKEFNRLQEELKVPTKRHLVTLVDAFSSVSGGSIYAYQLGRSGTCQ